MNGCISLVGKAGKTVHNCLNPAGEKAISGMDEGIIYVKTDI
jgi:hypothetical protein